MKNVLALVIIIISIIQVSIAQDHRKLDMQLYKMMVDPELQQKHINLLVEGDVDAIRIMTENHGGLFRYSVGNIATVKIPVSAIFNFSESVKVKRIENPARNYTAMNDSMRSTVNVNQVHAGVSPLPQGYDGTGVILGIIDTGVDLTHPDLQDSAGNTRVLHLWDQRLAVAPNTPPAYGYGQEWNNTQIDAGLAAASNDVQGFGHGTHVTGITAGDGSANGKNKGIAPSADIIEVAFDFNNTTDPTYIDAVDYIFTKAQPTGKPCVINASLGDYYGSHDGYDLQSQMIKTLLNQQPGRAMVAAAGNAGTLPFHLGYNVTTDTSFTWIKHNPAFPNLFFQIWGDTSDFDNIDYSIGADVNTTTSSFRGNLSFRNIFYNLGVFKQDTLFSTTGNRLAIIQSFGSIQGPAYSLEINIIPDSSTYQWRLMTTGSGRLDMWKFYDGAGGPGYINTGLPLAAIVPEIIYYKKPDSLQTIVSGFQCLDNVITVGNYGNRNSYVTLAGTTYTDANVTPGQIATNSSWGPTRDGRIKPDISAPGGIMLSCGQLSLLTIWAGQPGNAPKIAEGGFHFRDGGTSSSSPVVAGIAALYLQRNPTATAIQVRDAIVNCAVQDTFTGTSLPNNIWGHGKADALNTLTNCNLTSIEDISQNNNSILIYPNPVNGSQLLTVDAGIQTENSIRQLKVIDPVGKLIFYEAIPANGKLSIGVNKINSGIYFIAVEENGKINAVSKVNIIH